MIKVHKEKNYGGYRFDITIDNKTFTIEFLGNLDLYWYTYFENDDDFTKEFLITKENFVLYSLFLKLYSDIENFDMHTNNIEYIKNNCITFQSDEEEYNQSNILKIHKNEENFTVIFDKTNSKMEFNRLGSIRIRNSGSQYGYLNIPFMKMYLKMCESIENDYHQIHLEEFLYDEHKKKHRV